VTLVFGFVEIRTTMAVKLVPVPSLVEAGIDMLKLDPPVTPPVAVCVRVGTTRFMTDASIETL
jgi:hypothetical protein